MPAARFVGLTILAAAFAVPAGAQATTKTVIGTMQPNAVLAPAIMVGNTLYISGNTPPRNVADSSIAVQTKATITLIQTRLKAAEMDLSDVVAVTVYLADIKDFAEFSKAYGEMFTADPKPTRTTVAVAGLVGGAKLELTMTAVKTK